MPNNTVVVAATGSPQAVAGPGEALVACSVKWSYAFFTPGAQAVLTEQYTVGKEDREAVKVPDTMNMYVLAPAGAEIVVTGETVLP